MASSPDVSQYANLTLYDVDPSTLVSRFVLNAQALIPGWNSEEATDEMVTAQGLALVISELVYAVNRLPGAAAQTFLQLFGIVRNLGEPATATVTFNLAPSSINFDIPLDTQLSLAVAGQTVFFATTADTEVTAGTTTVTVPVSATTNTTLPNGIAVGTQLTPLGQLFFVNTIVLATSPSGGANPETNQQWLNRGITKLQGISPALVVPTQFTAAALNDLTDGVFRAFTVNNWNPTLSGGAGAISEGCVTVAVLAEGDVELTTGQQNDLQSILEAGAVAGLSIFVVNPNVLTLPITCTVWQEPGFTVDQVKANIATQLAAPVSAGGAGLTTDQWPWSSVVRLNALITAITQTPGVAFVATMTSPNADVSVPGVAPLVQLGAVTVTVEGP
jgi:hypothetical protein